MKKIMRTFIRAALVIIPLSLAACKDKVDQHGEVNHRPDEQVKDINRNTLDEAKQMNENKEGLDSKCAGFAAEAALAGKREVEMGTAASAKANSKEVKVFAQQIVADHTKANTELRELAAKKNITLPDQPSESKQADTEKLMKEKGEAFDQAFMQMMVNDHRRSVKIFEDAAEDCEDAEIKKFASDKLPILRNHLELAELMSEALKKKDKGYTRETDKN